MDDASTAARAERQAEVLDAALDLLVEKGDRLTMEAVARRASCSKETLYKWFGDRDGLLTATVRRQASQVHAGGHDAARLDEAALRSALDDFAATWLRVVSGPTSIALNRAAAAHAAAGKGDLGQIVLAEGRFAIGERIKPLLETAKAGGLLAFDDAETAFRTLFGLVARDVQIRLLLGDALSLTKAEIERHAALAIDQFLALYGATKPPAQAGQSSP